MTAVIFLS